MGDLRRGSSYNDSSRTYRSEMILKIYDNRSNCKYLDVNLVPTINNDGLTIKIPAHKVILGNYPFFAKLFETSCSSTTSQGPLDLQLESDSISIEIALRYIYTGQVELNGDNWIIVLGASKHFKLPELTKKCFTFMLQENHFRNVEMWMELFRFAISPEADQGRGFQDKVFDFLRIIPVHSIYPAQILTLDYNEIKILLEPSNRIFPTQADFNKAILKWVTFRTDRQQYIDELSNLKWDDTIVVNLTCDNDDNENLNNQNPGSSICNHQNEQNNHQQILSNQMIKRPRLSVSHEIIFLVENDLYLDSLYSFSFDDGKISKLIDMPIYCLCFGLISTKNRLFLLGGNKMIGNRLQLNREMYSFSLNQDVHESQLWEKEINLVERMSEFSTILVNESIYVVGGKNEANSSMPSIYMLNLDVDERAEKWRLFSILSIARRQAGVAVLNNILYICGGMGRYADVKSEDIIQDSVEMVYLDTKVRFLQRMKMARFDHQLIAFNNKLYAIGGMIYCSVKKENVQSYHVETYSPASGKWTFGIPMLDSRSKFVAFATDKNIFVLGGNGKNGDKPTMEKFDPITNTWTRIDCPEFPKGSNFYNSHVHITN